MGSIFLKNKHLQTELIPEQGRTEAVEDFCQMHHKATMYGDKFFADQSLYGDPDAPIFRYFQTWGDFKTKNYGKGVDLRVWEALQNTFVQNPNIDSLKSSEDFCATPEPHAIGGFRTPSIGEDVVVDVPTWLQWKKIWFLAHPESINWGTAFDPQRFFVNSDIICCILKNEIKRHISIEHKTEDKIEIDKHYQRMLNTDKDLHEGENANKPLKPNSVALCFHKYVMQKKSADGERQGYAYNIAKRICEENYYHETPDLAAMEKAAAPNGRNKNQRNIFFVKRADGTFRFISVDFEKGMLEFHADDGSHLGEYRFDGSCNEHADMTGGHNLRCITEWKRRHG